MQFIGRCNDTSEGPTKDHAWANLEKLIEETGLEGVTFKSHPTDDPNDGCFPFIVTRGRKSVNVDMFGFPLSRVRRSNVLRLYVDGCSWIWKYAVEALSDALTEDARDAR